MKERDKFFNDPMDTISSIMAFLATSGRTEAFNTLELPIDASDAEIKKARRELLLKYHPDHCPRKNDTITAEDCVTRFQNVEDAARILLTKPNNASPRDDL